MNPSPAKKRVLIVENEEMCRHGLVQIMQGQFEVVGEVEDSAEVLAAYEKHRPDVVLMDIILLSEMSGVECTEKLCQLDPDAKVIVMTSDSNADARVHRAFAAGARSIVFKSGLSAEKLRSIIADVAEGEVVLPPEIVKILKNTKWKLNERQEDILRRVSIGESYKVVGPEVSLSVASVKSEMRKIEAKLGAKNGPEAVAIAKRRGVID